MHAAPQPSQPQPAPSSYSTASTGRQFSQQSPQTREHYARDTNPSARRPVRQQLGSNGNGSPNSSQHYTSPSTTTAQIPQTPRSQPPTSTHASPQTPIAANSPIPMRTRAAPPTDQQEGPPVPPPRTSSQQQNSTATAPPSTAPLESRVAASRQARQSEDQRDRRAQDRNHVGDYNENERGSPRDNSATNAASAARTRRRAPPSAAETPQRAASAREGRTRSSPSTNQKRSDAAVDRSAAPPLDRNESEVINRLVITDPAVDLEREQERIKEAQPQKGESEATVAGLGLVGSEGVSDAARGARRQDYSNSSRRKDIKFGEYVLGQTLGEGEFGKVKLGWKKDGSVQVAIKLIRRESVQSNPSRLPKIYREIAILRELSHPNIVRLHEMVETDRHIGIILEYASGGELFDYILNHRYLKDPAARRLFAQLVSGVGYLHKKGIVHRDLKLENLLLDRNRNIIITDFGFANTFNPADELGEDVEYSLSNRDVVRKLRLDRVDDKGMRRGDLMQTSCGSPCYAAPELVVSDGLYTGRKVDVWSCGVILYAMLAGYLPFDDDPANPEGDNINLLYKYITTTPLTFPEYVTPHARDLLRRILVPDPRKRADLFEVARHSWLNEYHHVVSHITSSTTNIADIANSTVPAENNQEASGLARSASVREPTKAQSGTPSAVGGLSHHQGTIGQDEDTEKGKPARSSNRRTVQIEYVAPQSETARGAGPATQQTTAPASRVRSESHTDGPSTSKPLPHSPPVAQEPKKVADYPVRSGQQSMPPPSSRPQGVPRSVSEFSQPLGSPQAQTAATRPSTGGSMTSASGGIRLSSRGNSYSYNAPVAPTITTTNAQGKLAQPKDRKNYVMSGSMSNRPQALDGASGRADTQQLPAKFNETSPVQAPMPVKSHKRSSTLSGLGERLFGRSNSVKNQSNSPKPKRDKKYPPTSMKDPYPPDPPRQSTESRRSSSFGFGRKKSIDIESQEERPRRFSLLPASFSLKGLGGGNRDSYADSESQTANVDDFPQPPSSSRGPSSAGNTQPRMMGYGANETLPLGHDGHQDRSRTGGRVTSSGNQFSSRYGPQQNNQSAAPSDDVYGGTGVFNESNTNYAGRSYLSTAQTPPTERHNPMEHRPVYPEGFNSYDEPRASMQQGRTNRVLQKNNRRFADAYDTEQGPGHHDGSTGAARKVMDFFRRRRTARDER
ncbi:MAG: hypothetical protein Q9227_000554 [Pyrenula ochraceoflavens]